MAKNKLAARQEFKKRKTGEFGGGALRLSHLKMLDQEDRKGNEFKPISSEEGGGKRGCWGVNRGGRGGNPFLA